jgi:hypothetical protein
MLMPWTMAPVSMAAARTVEEKVRVARRVENCILKEVRSFVVVLEIGSEVIVVDNAF